VPLALSTGHEVGLAVTGAVFIAFALASSFLFPRFRPQYPGSALPAFIVVAFVFFFGMLTAVEVFGAETKKKEAVATTSQPTVAPATAASQTVAVTESEFKIALASTTLTAGKVTFDVKNVGKIQHDLAIKGGPKTKLISPGGSAQLVATLKPGKYHLYCTVPGHEQAGMKVDITVTGTAPTTTAQAPAVTGQKAATVAVTESEFKIALASTTLKAGKVTFDVKNTGKIQHDLAIKGGPKTNLISPGGSAQLVATLKPGKYHLYCTVPGHEQAGMKVDITVTGTAPTKSAQAPTLTEQKAATVAVTESEFKIALPSTTLKAGKITFDVKNTGKIQHDLAIKGGPKTKLISPGGSAQLVVTLKPGKYHLYCTVPGHEQAGMKVDVTVS
jgi:uncharacterized cupredoxin-like copper-binding protein